MKTATIRSSDAVFTIIMERDSELYQRGGFGLRLLERTKALGEQQLEYLHVDDEVTAHKTFNTLCRMVREHAWQ